MNTIPERYDSGWKHLEAKISEDNSKLEARLGKDIAKIREDIAKRDTVNTCWFVGVITAATVIIIAVMAALVSNT